MSEKIDMADRLMKMKEHLLETIDMVWRGSSSTAFIIRFKVPEKTKPWHPNFERIDKKDYLRSNP